MKKEWVVALVLVWVVLAKPLQAIKEFVKTVPFLRRRRFCGKIKC